MNILAVLDPLFSIPIIGLSGISLFLIASTSPNLFVPQVIAFIVGFLLYVFFASVDLKIWTKYIWIIYLFSIFFISLSFLGSDIRGASRWINIGSINLQPSEIVKPFIILIFAYLFTETKIRKPLTLLRIILLFLPFVILIFKQPDLGNVLVYFAIFMSLYILSGLPSLYYIVTLMICLLILPFSWFILHGYQKQRIISFLNPKMDPIGTGYNAIQAIIAIGSGQFFGLGLGRGTQSSLLFLPEYHTDFVFASLGEELGFTGGFIVIILYFCILGRILSIAISSEDNYEKLLTIGIFTQLFTQVFINIGMNLGLLPITGITLPLMSYGGTSIVSTFIGLGLIVSVAKSRKNNPLVIR